MNQAIEYSVSSISSTEARRKTPHWANGYVAATILTDPERAPTLEGVEIDAAPGAQRLLAESFGGCRALHFPMPRRRSQFSASIWDSGNQ
jgi:hypothetical protein